MPKIYPFNAWLPKPEFAHEVVAKPGYKSNFGYTSEWIKSHPNSFYQVKKPELFDPSLRGQPKQYIYQQIRKSFLSFHKKNCLQTFANQFFVYQQETGEHIQTGIIANCSTELYENGEILRHEHTIQKKEQDLIQYLQETQISPSPLFLSYRKHESIQEIVSSITSTKEPVLHFQDGNQMWHTVWAVGEENSIRLQEQFEQNVTAFYIADGHHRAAATYQSFQNWPKKGNRYGNMMVSLFPDDNLRVLPFYRIIRSFEGVQPEFLIQKLMTYFDVSLSPVAIEPKSKTEFGMYFFGKWYRLQLKQEFIPSQGKMVDSLGVSLWSKFIGEPILHIYDQRNDPKIDFVGGVESVQNVIQMMRAYRYPLAFTFEAVDIHDLFSVSDEGDVMPPKSTWFEPKIPGGLFISELK